MFSSSDSQRSYCQSTEISNK